MLPFYLLVMRPYGWTVEDIDKSCPAELEDYVNAYYLDMEEKDRMMHTMGIYVRAAVGSCFSKDSEYPQKPLMQSQRDDNKSAEELDEEIRKDLYKENQWVDSLKEKGLPETVI